jgi:hypothetical protein
LIICTLLVLACVVSTTLDWIKGKTGPFGPNPADWWGCGAFTLVLVIVMYLVGRQLF